MADVQDGDSLALGELFRRHHAAAYRYFLRMSGNGAVSEDLTQELFLRILSRSSTWQPGARFTSWMYRIAHNAFIDHSRKRKRETGLPEHMEPAVPAENGIEKDQEEALLRRALDSLPADRRELLILSRFQGMRYDEIGDLLGIEPNTAKVRVFRALGQLREAYQRLSAPPVMPLARGKG